MQETPVLTVIVLNFNGAHLLGPCLDALAAQDLPAGTLTVWVVDNGSADHSLDLLAREYPWVTVLRSERNLGFAGGNNLALRRVRTPYVALANNDTRPEPDWARRLLAPFTEAGTEGDRLAAVTGKILFQPRFLPLTLHTAPARTGPVDGRELGVRVHRVELDGEEVTERVRWDELAHPPEGRGERRFRWTRPHGPLLVPCAVSDAVSDGVLGSGPVTLALRLSAPEPTEVRIGWDGGEAVLPAGPEPETVRVPIPPGVAGADVLNNAGGLVWSDGYGADRGYQQVDRGQYDQPGEVFAFCGGSVCLRTAALREADLFDPDFFLYYEDTDLSWRLRAAGWTIRYEPSAVTRHLHSASTVAGSELHLFHTERNRLLMLVKNARLALAAREVARYPLTTLSLAVRELARARRTGRPPSARPTLLRLRVLGSFLRLLPRMLLRRRGVARLAVTGRGTLEDRWLEPR